MIGRDATSSVEREQNLTPEKDVETIGVAMTGSNGKRIKSN